MKNKILRFLLSLVIAFGVWLYVITVISPGSEKTYHNINVDVQGIAILEQSGLIITSDIDQTVTVELAGNRIDLNKLNNSNITVSLDVSKINEVGENQKLYYDIELGNSAITGQKVTPASITVNVEKLVHEEIEVLKPEVTGAEGYYVDWDSLEYDEKIMISGPEKMVSKIKYAKIAPLQNQDARIKGAFTYELYDANDKPLTRADKSLLKDNILDTKGQLGQINMSLMVVPQRTIVVSPKIKEGGGLTLEDVEITYSTEEIVVYGSDDLLDKLEEALGKWEIDLSKIPQEGETEPFQSLFLEEVGFVNSEERITQITADVRYKSHIRTGELTITTFTSTNVPQGMSATIGTKSLTVLLRGSKTALEKIGEEDLVATVDFSGSQEGTGAKPVTIKISGEQTDVGVVGTYTVSATVKKQ